MHNGMGKTVFVIKVLMWLGSTASAQVLSPIINVINAIISLILRWLMEFVYATMASISQWASALPYQQSTTQ